MSAVDAGNWNEFPSTLFLGFKLFLKEQIATQLRRIVTRSVAGGGGPEKSPPVKTNVVPHPLWKISSKPVIVTVGERISKDE